MRDDARLPEELIFLTMKRNLLFALSSALACNSKVSAFGPRIESAYSFHGSSSTAIKGAASAERDEDEERHRGVMAPKHAYTLPQSGDSVFDLLYNQNGEGILLPVDEPFVMEDLLSGLLEQYESSIATDEDCGADCESCLIPEEFKRFPNDQEFDVMAYLGIKRAKPVQATTLNLDRESEFE
jgi:hypothetical protein